MGSEDNFLRLDPMQCDTEIEYLLKIQDCSLEDITKLYEQGEISEFDYEYAKSYFMEDVSKTFREEKLIKSSGIRC